jgi:hypothetical protein
MSKATQKIWKSARCECKNKIDALKLSSCTSALRQIALCTNKNKEKILFFTNNLACSEENIEQTTSHRFHAEINRNVAISVPGSLRYLRRAGVKFQGFLSPSQPDSGVR